MTDQDQESHREPGGDEFTGALEDALGGRVGKNPAKEDESEEPEASAEPSGAEPGGDSSSADSVSSSTETTGSEEDLQRDTGVEQDTDTAGDTGSTSTTGSKGGGRSEASTGTSTSPGPDPDPTSTRSTRSQYPLYLTEDFQDVVDGRFEKYNAQRVMNDQDAVEKHKHFLEAVLRAGLDHDNLDNYIEDMVDRY